MTTADDRDEISALLYSYAFLIDRGDFEGWPTSWQTQR